MIFICPKISIVEKSGGNKVKWVEYKNERILSEDYRGLSGEKMHEVLNSAEKEYVKLTEPVLVMHDFTDCVVNTEFIEEFRVLAKQYTSMVKKSACIGITGAKKILAKGILSYIGRSDGVRFFDTVKDALEYLTAD